MAKVANIVITDTSLDALRGISSYRYLSVNQVSTITGLKPKSASELLLRLERQKLLASFGNTGVRGYGKTPKVYYLTKSGHRVLSDECEHLGLNVEPYRQVSVNSRWSPMMYHRLATLDVMMALERDSANLENYRLAKTLVEYRREKINNRWQRETTDYVAEGQRSEDKIVPDAGFVLENVETQARALFLIEVDCGTERLTTTRREIIPQTFLHKINQYDRYLESMRCRDRYKAFGEFKGFVLLVITSSDQRMHNMRSVIGSEKTGNSKFYRFTTLEKVRENFFHSNWWSRDCSDHETYQLIRGT